MNTTLKQIRPETLKLIEKHAENLGVSTDEFLRGLLAENQQELALKPEMDDEEFEADIIAFAEGTENLPSYDGTYTREDIYLDHN